MMKYRLFLQVICMSLILIGSNTATSTGANANKAISKGISKILGKKTYDNNTLTPEDLKRCMILNREIEKTDSYLDAERKKLKTEESSITQIKNEIMSSKSSLDHTNKEAVAKFNQNVKKYNSMRDAYNQKASKFSEEANSYTKMSQKYNEECASKSYYEEDYAAVKKEMEKK